MRTATKLTVLEKKCNKAMNVFTNALTNLEKTTEEYTALSLTLSSKIDALSMTKTAVDVNIKKNERFANKLRTFMD